MDPKIVAQIEKIIAVKDVRSSGVGQGHAPGVFCRGFAQRSYMAAGMR